MKCRIIKKDGKFYAQYETVAIYPHCGKLARSHKVWKTLKRKVDLPTGGYEEFDFFNKSTEAEHALRDFAESKSEGKIIKEFEV